MGNEVNNTSSGNAPNKNLWFVILGVLVIGAAATLFLDQKEKKSSQATVERQGESLFLADKIEKLTEVTLKKADQSLVLSKKAGGKWMIGEPTNFPAASQKIFELFDRLSEAKIVRLVSREGTEDHELNLDKPDTIQLKGDGVDQVIHLGKDRPGGGRFVKLGADKAVWLVDPPPQFATDAESWIYKTLISVKEDAIKSVNFPQASPAFELTREKKEDDLAVKGLAEKEKMKDGEGKRAKTVLSEVTFMSKSAPSESFKSALAKAKPVEFKTFDDKSYTIKIVMLETPKPAAPEPEKKEGEAKKEDKPKAPEMERKYYLHLESSDPSLADSVALMALWQFEVSEFVANNFRKERHDFVETNKS